MGVAPPTNPFLGVLFQKHELCPENLNKKLLTGREWTECYLTPIKGCRYPAFLRTIEKTKQLLTIFLGAT